MQRISQEIYDFSVEKNIPLEKILERIQNNEPWEYIRGTVEFHGNILNTRKGVLIPRLETEGLVDLCIKEIEERSPTLVIDMGTGSGAIVLSLAEYFKDTDIKFLGIDISKEALDIAEENKKKLGIDNCEFVQSDLLENIKTNDNYCIVSNLPYVPTDEYLNLNSSVKDFEPRIAIDGGKDGHGVFRRLFKEIQEREIKPLFVFLECHSTEIKNTRDIASEYFPNTDISVFKDCFNVERFLEISSLVSLSQSNLYSIIFTISVICDLDLFFWFVLT
jgi:release factor glutamine methyltransferase